MFGMLTKQQAKVLTDMTIAERRQAREIANMVVGTQYSDETVNTITINVVVTDRVEALFKNTMQYATDYVKQGYPAGSGLLRSISWA